MRQEEGRWSQEAADGSAKTPQVTSEVVLSCRSALRRRLKHGLHVAGAADACVAQLESLFERTVAHGESQSGLLLGSVGSAKRAIVLRAMRKLRDAHGPFTTIYLNGTLLQNELEAFKEMVAQLTKDKAVKHPVRDLVPVGLPA